MTGLQAFLRVLAMSRRDWGRERTLVLHRLIAILHWLLPPCTAHSEDPAVPGSSQSIQFNFSELKYFFAHHVHWRSWIDYKFSLFWKFWSGCQHYLGFNRRIKRSFVRILELVNMFRQIPCYSAGHIFLGARSPHAIFPRVLARKVCAHDSRNLRQLGSYLRSCLPGNGKSFGTRLSRVQGGRTVRRQKRFWWVTNCRLLFCWIMLPSDAYDSYSGSIVSILNISRDVSRYSIHDYCYPEMYRDTIFMIEIYLDIDHDTVSLSVSSRFVLRSVFLRLHARFSVSLVCVGDPDKCPFTKFYLKIHSWKCSM